MELWNPVETANRDDCSRADPMWRKCSHSRGKGSATSPMSSTSRTVSRLRGLFKRVVDVTGATTGLIATLPLMAVIALLIRSTMGAPILFRQRRPGLYGRPFTLVKFRTMSEDRLPSGELCPEEMRLTRLGKFLRRTSLDELPQLWNVLRGEISLVGPRPLLMQYLDRYSEEQMRRHDVKPGITGWAQINGRNTLSWEQKFSLDVWYVDNWSIMLDFRILVITIVRVLSGKGVSQDGCATAKEFMGNCAGESSDSLR